MLTLPYISVHTSGAVHYFSTGELLFGALAALLVWRLVVSAAKEMFR